MILHHHQPGQLQHAVTGLHQALLKKCFPVVLHDAQKVLVRAKDVHVLRAVAVRCPHELSRVGVDLGAATVLAALDELTIHGIHHELEHLGLHGAPLPFELHPLCVAPPDPSGKKGSALELDDAVHLVDARAHHLHHEGQSLSIHTLFDVST